MRLLTEGPEAFALRTALADHAQATLDIQTFMLGDDRAGRAVLKRMLDAAQRGVRVRLLLDDMTSVGKQELLAAFDSHPNIEVRVFNPVPAGRGSWLGYFLALAVDFDQRHRRMHNKLWLADGVVGITGGRNLSDEYFEVAPDDVNFNDLDVMAIGPVVSALSDSFDDYWNHPLAVPLRYFSQAPTSAWRDLLVKFSVDARQKKALSTQPSAQRFVGEAGQALLLSLEWAPAIAIWDRPEKLDVERYPALELTLLGQLGDAFRSLDQRLLLISPYVVPTPAGASYHEALADRGVSLTVITNSLESTDQPSLHGAYMPWRPVLLSHGARLFELRPRPPARDGPHASGEVSGLHIKAMAFDDDRVFIGTMNADPRSVWWNSEVGLLIDSPALGNELWSLAEQGMDPERSYEVLLSSDGRLLWRTEMEGRRVILNEEPGGAWRKFKAWFIRRLDIEHLL
ncbi:phospholipase D family protein [Litchfieldella qijiaojingensis]|uniref:Phospholipase D family protein n=1 Tax=Litchfieldella qijiaojingensis TaxID=980347 RepID=A0ABQ2ZA72_9GAMM|nr:phospholipase D family protein [Halomonas qijiaojingensis]GGY09825.1 phospholipase D family protein [Halomonas qijiaojingensis]